MKNRKVIAAWAEKPSGPGWSNSIIWALLQNTELGPNNGELSLSAVQPQEQTHEMRTLFDVSFSVHKNLTPAVARHFESKDEPE